MIRNIAITLGSSYSGLALMAHLYDEDGASVGSYITSDFHEFSNGMYLWKHDFDDDFAGCIAVYNSVTSGLLVIGSWNPENSSSGIVNSINDKLSEQHGAGQWGLTSSNGSYQVTFVAKDGSGDPIGGAVTEVWASGGSIVGLLNTNSSTGKAIFNLDAGAYDVRMYKHHMYSFTNPLYIDITSNISVDISGTFISTPNSPEGDLIRLYAYVEDLGLTKQAGVELIVTPSGQVTYEGDVLIVKTPSTALSDANGYVYVDVASGIPVRITIPKAQYERWYTTTSTALTDLATI